MEEHDLFMINMYPQHIYLQYMFFSNFAIEIAHVTSRHQEQQFHGIESSLLHR